MQLRQWGKRAQDVNQIWASVNNVATQGKKLFKRGEL